MSQDEFYCSACFQRKEKRYFQIWISDKSKARRCDSCHDDYSIKERLRACQAEKKAASAMPSPALTKLPRELDSKHKCNVRAKLYDYQERKRLDDECGDIL